MGTKEALKELLAGGERLKYGDHIRAALYEMERQEEVIRTLEVELDISRSANQANYSELERKNEIIRTLEVELDILRAAIRADLPGTTQLTRHTITLRKPLPEMNAGDSLLLVVVGDQ
jgi:hypothetical protein